MDDKLNWQRHIESIKTKLSAAAGVLFNFSKYLPLRALMPIYYSIMHSHLQYAIINWGNSSTFIIPKLQVMQNRIVKIMCKRSGKKNKLLLELAKFMFKAHSNKLSDMGDEGFKFTKVSSVHSYPTRAAPRLKNSMCNELI